LSGGLFGAIDIDDEPVVAQTIPKPAWWKGLRGSCDKILLKERSQCLDTLADPGLPESD